MLCRVPVGGFFHRTRIDRVLGGGWGCTYAHIKYFQVSLCLMRGTDMQTKCFKMFVQGSVICREMHLEKTIITHKNSADSGRNIFM